MMQKIYLIKRILNLNDINIMKVCYGDDMMKWPTNRPTSNTNYDYSRYSSMYNSKNLINSCISVSIHALI